MNELNKEWIEFTQKLIDTNKERESSLISRINLLHHINKDQNGLIAEIQTKIEQLEKHNKELQKYIEDNHIVPSSYPVYPICPCPTIPHPVPWFYTTTTTTTINL